MIADLETLRLLRARVAYLKEQIAAREAPHLLAIERETAELRATLAAQAETERAWNTLCADLYAQKDAARTEALIRGEECPAVPLPPGCTVRRSAAPVVTEPALVPREFCAPNMQAIKRAKDAVPGVAVVESIGFAFRKV